MLVKLQTKMYYDRQLFKPSAFGVEMPDEAVESLSDSAKILKADKDVLARFEELKKERAKNRPARNVNEVFTQKARIEKLEKEAKEMALAHAEAIAELREELATMKKPEQAKSEPAKTEEAKPAKL